MNHVEDTNWNTKDRLQLVKFLQKETDKLMFMRFFPSQHKDDDIKFQEKKVKILNTYINDTY